MGSVANELDAEELIPCTCRLSSHEAAAWMSSCEGLLLLGRSRKDNAMKDVLGSAACHNASLESTNPFEEAGMSCPTRSVFLVII